MSNTPTLPTRLDLAGSNRTAPAAATASGPVPPEHILTASVYLTPTAAEPALTGSPADRRAQIASHRTSAHADGIAALQDFAADHGLTVILTDPARRLVRLSGTAASLSAAFGTTLSLYQQDGHTFHARAGTLSMPAAVHPYVESVLGLDTRPAAQPRIIRPRVTQRASVEPNQLARLYNFPPISQTNGAGQTIALIELGGGFYPADITQAFVRMRQAPPRVVAVSVDDAINDQTGSSADGEVALDIQVAGGVAPGAQIAVYFAPNSEAGFVDAISQAAHDATNKPSVISISWGAPEDTWTGQTIASMNSALQDAAALGISVYVAAGDNLANDGETDGTAHVDYPASSPYAIGCGGTHIVYSGNTITHETVWNENGTGTGGGISDLFPVPPFQAHVKLPPSVNGGRIGRGVPDVAGNAAPSSGYVIIVNGQTEVVGGTSAVAPLWAGLTALINQRAPQPVGFLPTWLYAHRPTNTALTAEMLHGGNRASGSALGYAAGPGWNACTGLGRPNGAALFAALTKAASA